MKKSVFLTACFALFLSGCHHGGDSPPPPAPTATPLDLNVLAVDVANCGSSTYINEPCVSVTICSPSSGQCQTIPNILLDTGSYGLRIFSSLISVSLDQETDSKGNPLAECAQFGTGSEWGPVKVAKVILGGEPAVQVPIEVVDSTYATKPSACSGADVSPSAAGYNGILGVGLFAQDCGLGCTTSATNGMYFGIVSNNPNGVVVPLSHQVSNPVASLPVDNNGVILNLPGVPSQGLSQASGTLTLGIDTRSNNATSSQILLLANGNGDIKTQFKGNTYTTSFIDSGSDGLFFPNVLSPAMAICSSGGVAPGFYCPGSTQGLTAVISGGAGSSSPQTISFQIANAESEVGTGNGVFFNIGGPITGEFDWGIPFFYGRAVFVGIEGAGSNLGIGPYWAY